jgi:ABC-type proline/glycine betaine transport system permease subunit
MIIVVTSMDAPERYEQLIAYVGSNLPAPVDWQEDADGSIQFIGGEPAEVVVLLTSTSVVVSEFSGVWETPFKFTAKPRRVGMLKWRRLSENAVINALAALIKGAREARLARFQTCTYCGHHTAPEQLHDAGVCQSCADQHSGAIH